MTDCRKRVVTFKNYILSNEKRNQLKIKLVPIYDYA